MKKNKKGFSLVELIAVIIIIGIIALIAVPVVSNYVNNSKDKTYITYENSMTQAAENKVLTCESDASLKCVLPDTVNEKTKIQLYELIEQGFIDNMKNPDSEEFCDADRSYVEVTKTGLSDYEYEACLYCGDYETEGVCKTVTLDNDDPECGEITGESTRWTKENRTISIKCSDRTSGCEKQTFSKTFTTTTKEGTITIQDKSGRTKQCPVKVYVDKTLPTCELEVVEGDYISSAGWYSLNAKVKLKSTGDNESGLLTYGIGTSLENRNYDKETEITVGSGITTVVGYVKDLSGNEGVCGLDVRVGTSVPTFKFYYGYPIYPNKEKYTLSQITESPAQTLKTTGTNPTMTFTGLSHYGEIDKVRVTLTGNPSTATKASILSNGTVIGQGAIKTNSNVVEITIPKRSYDTLGLKLGELNNKTYNVSKIEVLTTRGNIITNQSVTVYVEQTDEGMKTTEATFNNGGNWQTELYKTFGSITTDVIKTRNKIAMESAPQTFSITEIDKVVPAVKITATKKTSGTAVASNTWSNEELTYVLEKTQSGRSGFKIYYCKDTANTCNPTTEVQDKAQIKAYNTTTGEYYIRYKIVSGSGNESAVGSYHAKVDTNKPTVNITATKKTSGTEVASNTWTDESLNFKFTQTGVGGSGATIYYCKDTANTCNPTTTIANNTTLSSYNTTTGTYYIRYKIKTGSGTESEIKTYIAKIDRADPTCTISQNVTIETKGTVVLTIINGTSDSGIISSGYSWTSKTSGFSTTKTKTVEINGTYTAWVKAESGRVGSCSITISNITLCDAGKYRDNTGYCATCPAGSYCPGKGNPTCPSGYTSAAGATAQNKCYMNVPDGKYVNKANDSSPTQCAAGTAKAAHTVYYGSTSSCGQCAAGTYSTAGAKSCTTCPTGYTSAAGATAQNKCYMNVPDGKYINKANDSSPTQCAAGTAKAAHTVNYGSTSSCGQCTAGTYSTAGAKSCTTCPSGYTSAAGATAQNKCYMNVPDGKYVNKANDSSPTQCAAGTAKAAHTVNYGSTSSCGQCAAGTYSAAGAKSCTQCAAGSYSGAGATSCTKCAAGKSSPAGSTSASACTNCAAGKYSVSGGTCQNCAAGTYSGAGASSCTKCVAGSYSGAGASACTACGAGKTSAAGSTSASACTSCTNSTGVHTWTTQTWNTNNTVSNLCKASKCKANYYVNGNSCSSCPTGTITDAGNTSTSCRPNVFTLTYNNNSGTGCTTKQVTYNQAYGTLCTPTRTGYTFMGWYTTLNGSTQVTSSSIYSTNGASTIYAKWQDKTPPTCTVTKTATGISGVNVKINCNDAGSGCSGWTENGLKASKTFTVTDGAGNKGTCSVTIQSKNVNCNSCYYGSNTCSYGCDKSYY